MIENAGIDTTINWPDSLVRELEDSRANGRVGQKLVSETDKVRVWHLSLDPGQRFGFHCHVLNYFWTALNPGHARSHYSDGRIVEVSYAAGDTRHFTFDQGDGMQHDLENIGETPLQFVTVEFLDSPNTALPV